MCRKIAAVFSGCGIGSVAVLGEVLLCPFVQGECIQSVMLHHKAVGYLLRNRFNVDVRIGNTAPVTILHLLPKGKTAEDVAANLFPLAHTFHTQYDMTQASYHWARASALNLMGLAALNLPKGIASLCTPARQKSEVCDLARDHSLHLSSVLQELPPDFLQKK